jgi:hypothetical protein
MRMSIHPLVMKVYQYTTAAAAALLVAALGLKYVLYRTFSRSTVSHLYRISRELCHTMPQRNVSRAETNA